jgi:hypothetical protein
LQYKGGYLIGESGGKLAEKQTLIEKYRHLLIENLYKNNPLVENIISDDLDSKIYVSRWIADGFNSGLAHINALSEKQAEIAGKIASLLFLIAAVNLSIIVISIAQGVGPLLRGLVVGILETSVNAYRERARLCQLAYEERINKNNPGWNRLGFMITRVFALIHSYVLLTERITRQSDKPLMDVLQRMNVTVANLYDRASFNFLLEEYVTQGQPEHYLTFFLHNTPHHRIFFGFLVASTGYVITKASMGLIFFTGKGIHDFFAYKVAPVLGGGNSAGVTVAATATSALGVAATFTNVFPNAFPRSPNRDMPEPA